MYNLGQTVKGKINIELQDNNFTLQCSIQLMLLLRVTNTNAVEKADFPWIAII